MHGGIFVAVLTARRYEGGFGSLLTTAPHPTHFFFRLRFLCFMACDEGIRRSGCSGGEIVKGRGSGAKALRIYGMRWQLGRRVTKGSDGEKGWQPVQNER